MTAARVPAGLSSGGRELWKAVAADHDLDAPQRVQLLEACRAKDRADKLDLILRGDADTWIELAERVPHGTGMYEVRVDSAMAKATEAATLMKQMLAALRLPDTASGRKPQRRGAPRGTYTSHGTKGGKISSLDRARAGGSA